MKIMHQYCCIFTRVILYFLLYLQKLRTYEKENSWFKGIVLKHSCLRGGGAKLRSGLKKLMGI